MPLYWNEGCRKTPRSPKKLIVDASTPEQVFLRLLFLMPFRREDQFKCCFELISDCFCVHPNLYLSFCVLEDTLLSESVHLDKILNKKAFVFFYGFSVPCVIYMRHGGGRKRTWWVNYPVCGHEILSSDLQQPAEKAVHRGTVSNPRAGRQRWASPRGLPISHSSQSLPRPVGILSERSREWQR